MYLKKRKSKQSETAGLSFVLDEIRKESGLLPTKEDDGIVDIVTFCNSEKYLNLPGTGLNLWLGQVVILKTLYLGSLGNENETLSDEEKNWLHERQLDNVLKRLQNKLDGVNDGAPHNFNFHELHLALGRRASKTLMASIIVAYESYKLIQIGDPYRYYNIPEDEEIGIINVSNSQNQSGRLFSQIKARIRNSPFFKGRVHNDATTSMIRLYTDIDLRKKDDPEMNISVDGSIVLICGHSNPDTLRGYSAPVIIFDELAFYDENPKISGKGFYTALKPSIGKFRSKGHGLLVEISSVNGRNGIFYELWKNAQSDNPAFRSILSYRLATWDINDDLPYDGEFLTEERERDPEAFAVEYGSMWSTRGIIKSYFAEDLIERAMKNDLSIQMHGDRKLQYHMHIDPAETRDNYAIAIVCKVPYVNSRGEKRFRVCLAYHRTWTPTVMGHNWKEIDQEIFDIYRRFRPATVTYDIWNSVQSLDYYKRHGINMIRLRFGRGDKAAYYQNLEDLLNRDELHMYYDEQIYGEFINLKFKPTTRGISINKDDSSDFPTDDLTDCIAGASWMAIGIQIKRSLPETMVANMGRW